MATERRTTRRERDSQPITPLPPVGAPAPVRKVAAPPAATAGADEHRRIALDDLEAIAKMDINEIAAMMSASTSRKRVTIGNKVTGTITRVGRDNVFLDIGEKAEAMMEREELPDANAGDIVTAYVLSTDETGIHLSRRLSGQAAGAFLDAAQQTGIPVEGKVTSRNPGGFEVRIGATRAFCPVSQIDRIGGDADLDKYVGQTLEFKVLELGERDVVVSRRALMEANLAERRAAFWEKAKIGDTANGVVVSAQPYGVFVDMDGVEGLVPKRELSWDDSLDPVAQYKRGMGLPVRIIDLDHESRKITLSAKDPSLSPWTRVGVEFVQGGTYEGTIVRTAVYGAFVEIAAGLSGLLHASRGGKKSHNVGDKVNVRITGVDHERQRLELSSSDAHEAAPTEGEGAIVKGVVQQVLKNGLVLDLEDGNSGFVPMREIDLPAGTLLAQRFRAGKELQARVIEHDASRRRSVLSLKLEVEDTNSWRSAAQQAPKGALGTFADLLSGVKVKKSK